MLGKEYEDEIVHLKLKTGEEVVARVTTRGDGSVLLKEPYAMVSMQRGDGSVGIGVVPLSMASPKADFVTRNSDISGVFEPLNSGLEQDYIKRTSNIEIVSGMSGIK